MTLEEIFKSNPELRNTPEVQMLIAYMEEQQTNNYAVNKNHMNFKTRISDLVFNSDQFAINGTPSEETIRQIVDLI